MEVEYVDYLMWSGMALFFIILRLIVITLKNRRYHGEFIEEVEERQILDK